jgi:hypothetical protein
MQADREDTDYESLHGELEDERSDMESRRDDLDREAQTARQDLKSKVSDQNVPGAQDEQEEIIHGREAVEPADEEDEEDGEGQESDEEHRDSEGGGSEGAGYREDEE